MKVFCLLFRKFAIIYIILLSNQNMVPGIQKFARFDEILFVNERGGETFLKIIYVELAEHAVIFHI